MTNVPVLGAEQFQFPCRVLFDSFCLKWFKLVSSQPNLQPKRKVIVTDFKFVELKNSYFFHIMMAASLKDTQRQLCVRRGGFKNSIQQFLKTVTFLGFFNIKEFYRSCNFGCFWWISKNIKPTCFTYQNLCMTSTIFLGFLLNFSTS